MENEMSQQKDKIITEKLSPFSSLRHNLTTGNLTLFFDKGGENEKCLILAPAAQIELIEYFESLLEDYL
jgi:hypothetical protein